MTARVPLSILDPATVRSERDSAHALGATTELARLADELGYARFWVAEHHNVPSVASTSPAVLIAHLAALTRRIHLGSGGVMLPNHTPFVIAEQFAMLEALHPGRIDLGIGRAPGSDRATSLAVRGPARLSADQFPEDLAGVLAYLGDDRVAVPAPADIRATPAPSSYPEVWMLGSSTYGAQAAAALGLPFTYAHHFLAPSALDAAAEIYRAEFRPSPRRPAPYLMVTASAIVADTREEAEFLAGPSQVRLSSMLSGDFGALITPEEAAVTLGSSAQDQRQRRETPGTQYAGTVDDVVSGLDGLVARSGADEIMITGYEYDPATAQNTARNLAQGWGLTSVKTRGVIAA